MIRLSRDGFLKAKEAIFSGGSDVDRAWFRYQFEHEDTEAFLRVLAAHQYDNGGFGGLVHEFEYQGPCLKCTEHAFRYLYYLKEKPPAAHPLIQRTMSYVLERYRPEIGEWGQLLEPEVNDGCHVWWWTYEKDERSYGGFDERVRAYNPNGQAALAAFVALYGELVPDGLYRDILRYPVEKVRRYYDRRSWRYKDCPVDPVYKAVWEDPYSLNCLQQLCGCLKDESLAGELKAILLQDPTACMELDERELLKGDLERAPFKILSEPNFLYAALREEADRGLDLLIRLQHPDGRWHLPYRFGEGERFDRLQAAYEVHATMLYLAQLNRFGRIESGPGGLPECMPAR